MIVLGLDIGSNSVGSAWIDRKHGSVTAGVSVFPAGVEESDEKRGDPKNAKRRMTRRTRITLARRSQRKRELRLKLIEVGLLPPTETEFKALLESTDPWELRRRGLDEALTPHEFGRALLHLAQRRGALGLRIPDPDEKETDEAAKKDGQVKKAIGEVQAKMRAKSARTFGEYIAMVRAERVTPITSEDRRPVNKRNGPREWRAAVRNKAASYEHCADRAMIRDEFARLWDSQRIRGGQTARLLTPELRLALDDESGDAVWRHKGLLFGQRRATWDLGTLGRCVLHPEERCVPHADMYASHYLVVETVNNLKIIERGKEARPLTRDEREKIKAYLSGPLGMETPRAKKGDTEPPKPQPKRTVTVNDLRNLMGTKKDGWGTANKKSNPQFRFNIETDEERPINTDWFRREIIHGAVTPQKWEAMTERIRDGLNRAILKYDPDEESDAKKLKAGVMAWAGLTEAQADALLGAWKSRPKPDAKRLSMSRRAVRNLLTVMDRDELWPDTQSPTGCRWLTQIEARKTIASNGEFADVTTGKPLDDTTRRRYATGAKGATARDRYYMHQDKHRLKDEHGQFICDEDGQPLAEPPPAPLVSNPVVRKAIHEVRRHLIEYMKTFRRKPDEVYIELAREARMGKMDADRLLFKNRLQNRIRNEIICNFDLESQTSTQQREAVRRVVLAVQQDCVCPLCGKRLAGDECNGITLRKAANGEGCEVAHIIPRASGGHNGFLNIVLAHTKCNRDMGKRTPRQYWDDTVNGGFDEGMHWVESVYGDIKRIKPSETKGATGPELWKCYLTEQARPKRGAMTAKPPNFFTNRFDKQKIEQFKKDVKDIQEMTARQDAATKYASRQVMAYLADALYDGQGLPERGGGRRIYATDGMWTSRLRREWGLFFDPHDARSHTLSDAEEHQRKEKNRGDHRHHAIDAVATALCTRQVQVAWEEREKQADRDGINTADEGAMEKYRRLHPLAPPAPFKTREEFRDAVKRAVFGDDGAEKPICHRPVKRRLVGAFHKESHYGPVLAPLPGHRTENAATLFTNRISAEKLTAKHLRVPEGWDELSNKLDRQNVPEAEESAVRRQLAALRDPSPGSTGIVRDRALRDRIRKCLRENGLDPDDFTANQIKQLVKDVGLTQASGVPIKGVVLLCTNTDPVIIPRKLFDPTTGKMVPHMDPNNPSRPHPRTKRVYDGGNNHHVEFREDRQTGKWSGEVVSMFDVARRVRIQKLPAVDRSNSDTMRFVMSLAEGEMIYARRKDRPEQAATYFVVCKMRRDTRRIWLAPHWDARKASEQDRWDVTPADLKGCGPDSYPFDVPEGFSGPAKVRISPLGVPTLLERD